ncbi:MAG: hypothetical protein RL266_2336 [Bacteroidota bacterium]|jgi:hypothetical protein
MQPAFNQRSKLFVVLFMVVSGLILASTRIWCSQIELFSTDLCWLVQARPDELARAFPDWYQLVYFGFLTMNYGLPALSLLLFIWVFMGKQLRQNLALTAFSVVMTLVLAEFGLRVIGYRPGQFMYNQWVQPVDTLYLYKGFITDENGILKVDTAIAKKIIREENRSETVNHHGLSKVVYTPELSMMLSDHEAVANNQSGLIANYAIGNRSGESNVNDILDDYLHNPINADGFYSIPFDTIGVPGRSVLLLGDSFTWGHSSSNKVKSFANHLLFRGYHVFNTGISGADVQQYEAVLKEYYPRLRPDVVVLNFFMGNDVTYFKRPVGPQYPIMYHTNAGSILSMHSGVYFSTVDSAYDNVMTNMRIPLTNELNRFMASTVITTYLWESMVNAELIHHEFFVGRSYPDEDITQRLMQPIMAYCDSVNVPLIISVIPKLENGELHGGSSLSGLRSGIHYTEPEMQTEMYDQRDGHFNDAGHLFYADYLQNLIDSCFQYGIR